VTKDPELNHQLSDHQPLLSVNRHGSSRNSYWREVFPCPLAKIARRKKKMKNLTLCHHGDTVCHAIT
jgi:hypothetical protein